MTIALSSLLLTMGGFYLYLNSQQTGILILDGSDSLTVRLNGRHVQTQKQPRGLFVPVYSGTYRIQIEKPDYQDFISDVTTAPGNIAEIRPAFTLVPSLKEAVGDAVDFVQPSLDEKYVYYLGDFRQRLYRFDVAAQQSVALTRTALQGVLDVQWGKNPEVALIVQRDGTYLHEIPTFDFKNQIFQKVAGPEIVSPVWDPQNTDRVGAAYISERGERSLVTADKRFSTVKRLTSLEGIPKPAVSWSPDGNFLLIRGDDGNPQLNNLWLYRLENGQFTQLTTTGGVVRAVVNPDATKILIETSLASGLQRSVLTISDMSTTQLPTSTFPGTTTWKDANSFFEPGQDGSLRLVSLSGDTKNYPILLPNPEQIISLFYVATEKRLVFATTTAVYSIDMNSN